MISTQVCLGLFTIKGHSKNVQVYLGVEGSHGSEMSVSGVISLHLKRQKMKNLNADAAKCAKITYIFCCRGCINRFNIYGLGLGNSSTRHYAATGGRRRGG